MAIKIKMKNILDVGTSIVLRKLGFGKFDNLRRLISIEEYGGEVPDMDLWLIPADKYDEIPKGYPVTDIFGKTEPFAGRKTCCKNDIGPCGLLPIGVLRPAEPEEPATEAKFITAASIVLDGKTVMAGTECTDARMLHVAVEAKAGTGNKITILSYDNDKELAEVHELCKRLNLQPTVHHVDKGPDKFSVVSDMPYTVIRTVARHLGFACKILADMSTDN